MNGVNRPEAAHAQHTSQATASGRRERPQRLRVLDALRAAGNAGVGTSCFLAPDVVDGGKPIVRLPSRIDELRKAGYTIVSHRAPNGTAIYRLVGEAAPAAACAPEPVSDDEPDASLFDSAPSASSSPYDPLSEWT